MATTAASSWEKEQGEDRVELTYRLNVYSVRRLCFLQFYTAKSVSMQELSDIPVASTPRLIPDDKSSNPLFDLFS